MLSHSKRPSLLLIAGLCVMPGLVCLAQTQNQAAVLRGQGAFLRGAGSYNLNTARATSINVDTVIRWKQDLRKIEAERRDLLARKEAGKKLRFEDVSGARETKVAEVTDNRCPTGAVGLRVIKSAYRFRNIKVTAPDGKVLLDGPPALP